MKSRKFTMLHMLLLALVLLGSVGSSSCRKSKGNDVQPGQGSGTNTNIHAALLSDWDGLELEAPDNQVTVKKDEVLYCNGGTTDDNYGFKYKNIQYRIEFISVDPVNVPMTNGKGGRYYNIKIVAGSSSYEGRVGKYDLVGTVSGTYSYYQLEITDAKAQGVFTRKVFEKKI